MDYDSIKQWKGFFLNKSNEIQLNHIFLKQWTDEIEFSQRGQANIIYTQGKPRTEVSAKHVRIISLSMSQTKKGFGQILIASIF